MLTLRARPDRPAEVSLGRSAGSTAWDGVQSVAWHTSLRPTGRGNEQEGYNISSPPRASGTVTHGHGEAWRTRTLRGQYNCLTAPSAGLHLLAAKLIVRGHSEMGSRDHGMVEFGVQIPMAPFNGGDESHVCGSSPFFPIQQTAQSPCFCRSRALRRSMSWTRSNSSSQSWVVAASSSWSGPPIPVGQAAPSCLRASAR